MLEDKMEKIIISSAAIDAINDNDNKFRSYKVQIMIGTIKSLVPLAENSGVKINYDRYTKELELLDDYFDKGKEDILKLNKKNYWNYKSRFLTSRIIPIVIANENYDVAKKEVIKNVLYSTGDIGVLLNSILLGKLLDLLIKNKEISYEEILLDLKSEIITFSQSDFLEQYRKEYMIALEEYDGNFLVDFERSKIQLINLLNGVESEKNKLLRKSLDIIKSKENKSIVEINDLFLSSILGVYSEKVTKIEYNDKNFIIKMSDYLIRLRKGRINLKDLRSEISDVPDLFKYNAGKVINHPLLNKCQIIKKYNNNSSIVIEVMTKSGLYKFQKYNTL